MVFWPYIYKYAKKSERFLPSEVRPRWGRTSVRSETQNPRGSLALSKILSLESPQDFADDAELYDVIIKDKDREQDEEAYADIGNYLLRLYGQRLPPQLLERQKYYMAAVQHRERQKVEYGE